MYLPIELQRHILSYIIQSPEFFVRKSGKCRAITKSNRRCLRKVHFDKALCCPTHDSIGHILANKS
jgi:hypothetical protein